MSHLFIRYNFFLNPRFYFEFFYFFILLQLFTKLLGFNKLIYSRTFVYMNKVVEVADAEEVTGNAFSLAIATPDRVHFVKGTCREEARWWADVLSVFPRSKVP